MGRSLYLLVLWLRRMLVKLMAGEYQDVQDVSSRAGGGLKASGRLPSSVSQLASRSSRPVANGKRLNDQKLTFLSEDVLDRDHRLATKAFAMNASIMEPQLCDQQIIPLDAVHHAMLIRDAA